MAIVPTTDEEDRVQEETLSGSEYEEEVRGCTPEPKEEEEVAAFPVDLVGALWGWSCSAPEMARAVEAVNWCPTGAGGLATGGGAAGQLPPRPRAPGTAGPPLAAAALHRPRQRRRRQRHRRRTITNDTRSRLLSALSLSGLQLRLVGVKC